MIQTTRWFALLALVACSRATRAPGTLPAVEQPCELLEVSERAADSAVAALHSPIAAAHACALRLVAGSLRPWLGASLEPWTVTVATAATGDAGPLAVTVRPLRAAQARDALDAESVRVVTEDFELVEYAKARHDLAVVALPWDRLYVRVGAASHDALAAVDPTAVGAEARRAAPLPECATLSELLQTREIARSSRAVYLRGDRTGRELAERLVGIGDAREVVGLDSVAFEVALTAGADAAYILSLPLTEGLCDEFSALLRRASWADHSAIAPLIETRAYAITRRARAP